MKRTSLPGRRWLLAVIVSACALTAFGATDILDPNAYHPLLRVIAADLDRRGIDVVQDWNSKVATRNRDVLAPLGNYLKVLRNPAPWERALELGEMGALVALPAASVRSDTFKVSWDKAPRELRVFLSFAREDALRAKEVAEVLRSRGYAVFIYINDPTMQPMRPLSAVGEYLRTAGMHLVLDTANARRKPGVLAEALLGRTYGVSQERVVVSLKRGDEVVIYGARKRCPRTQNVLAIAERARARIVYRDIDDDPAAREYVKRNQGWLQDNKLLPLVKVNGSFIRAQDIESFGVRGAEEKNSLIENPDCSTGG